MKTSKNLNRERTDDRRKMLKSIISGGFLIFLQVFTLFCNTVSGNLPDIYYMSEMRTFLNKKKKVEIQKFWLYNT